MKKDLKNKRRDFLMNVCPTVAMAFLGVTVLESCSSGDDDTDIGNATGNNGNGGNNNSNSGSGYTKSGNVISINLDHSNFSSLKSNNWMNFTAQNMLILKIDSSTYRAFTNACPHQGNRNNWSFNSSNNRFQCSAHGNSYPSDCNTAGTAGGVLKCYTTSLSGTTLKVTV
ncbi:MAG: Rieske 2Fe-2S domain-containing protein [Flavobacteriaceae bacterium]|jgi:hypothetical protein|tara:strand:- start:1025 stop:1534 length:510 start_codon:yes stop_codon:yes gene_type:complete